MSKKELLRLQNGSDVRGIALDGVAGESVNLTENDAFRIGSAFAYWLSIKHRTACEKIVVGIGRDSRITGEKLMRAVACGLSSQNVRVVDCSMATTPAMFMSCVFGETKYTGSVMITASHLPYNRNGIKFFDADGGLDHADIEVILELASSIDSSSFSSASSENPFADKFDLITLYSSHLKNSICKSLGCTENEKPLSSLKIVVDSGNGASGFFVSKVLEPLGADTSGSQFLEPDGMFPNHIPNPENKVAMGFIQDATVKNNADLGLIFDTDVDRMSAVFPDGTEINRDSIIALISAIVAPEHPGSTIVTDSVTSSRLTYFLENVLHLKHLCFKRGYKNVIEKQIELCKNGIDCPLAMETSGHGALFENYSLDDGAYLAVKIIIALAKAKREGKTLESLIEKFPKAVPGEEGEFRFKILVEDFREYGKKVLAEFKNRAESKKITLPENFEGVRLSFTGDDVKGWILLRMSLHDPVMPLNIEGERKGDLEKLKKIAAELLDGFDKLDVKSLQKN
ncbi:MAG: phosphomannomutase/phosphoglucomutase [Treponema sp.]|nr:phosphomannomutase/phosphoglucomutase [Treponema sp.]